MSITVANLVVLGQMAGA